MTTAERSPITGVVGGSDSDSVLVVAVGSSNPCKVQAVQAALETLMNRTQTNKRMRLDICTLSVPSGVSHQPMGSEETKLGAKNRAKAAYDLYKQRRSAEPDLAFGLEGGLETTEDNENQQQELWCMAWMAVYGKHNNKRVLDALSSKPSERFNSQNDEDRFVWGHGKSGSFLIPPKVSTLILQQSMELGDADDKVFGRVKSKHGGGTVGLLTDGVIDRSHYYQHALILALVPWIRPDDY